MTKSGVFASFLTDAYFNEAGLGSLQRLFQAIARTQ